MRYRVSGCENCNISVNNGKYRVGFQPCDYKFFQKSVACENILFALRRWGRFARKRPQRRARRNGCFRRLKKALLDTNFGLRFLGLYLTKMLHFWNLSSGQEYISNKRFYKHDHFLTLLQFQ